MIISGNPPRSSSTLFEGKDVLRQSHSPRVLSKSIEKRKSTVSNLNTGNGLRAGHLPVRSSFISACCPKDESPTMLGLGRSCSFNFMFRPERCNPPHDCPAVRQANDWKRASRQAWEESLLTNLPRRSEERRV